MKALISFFLFAKEIKGVRPEIINSTLQLSHDLGQRDMFLNGKNKVTQQLGEVIAYTLKDTNIHGGPDSIVFSLNENKMPYPFHKGFNKELFVEQFYDFLINEQRIDCSKQDFLNHFINGYIDNKIRWRGKALEMPILHKMLIGGNDDFSGIPLLDTEDIHKLASAHFCQKNGKEFITNRMSSTLALGADPESHPFLVGCSNFLKKTAC